MDAEAYRNLSPQYNKLLSDVVDANINMLNILRTYGAAQDEVLGRENKEEQVEYVNRLKQGNKVAKSYNLVRALTGSGPMLSEDVSSGTDNLRFYSGSTKDKAAADKVRKSYELLRLFGGGSR